MAVDLASIVELFRIEKSDFVAQAYQAILGRDADSSGLVTYSKQLGSGSTKRRKRVILSLARSAEGRGRHQHLPLIATEAARLYRWRFLPWNRTAIALSACQPSVDLSKYQPQTVYRTETVTRAPDIDPAVLEHIMRSLKGMGYALKRIEDRVEGGPSRPTPPGSADAQAPRFSEKNVGA